MDFTYSEEQEAVRELAGRIFTERVTHERLKEIEQAAAAEGPIDRGSGASWPMPAFSVSPSTRSTAAPVSTSWPPAWSSRPPVAPRPTSR